jgi:Mrp family chromosome partitioning ATPase
VVNYIVVAPGHIAQFCHYEAARIFASDSDGVLLNMAGFINSRCFVRGSFHDCTFGPCKEAGACQC